MDPASSILRFLVADDHALTRVGVRVLLGDHFPGCSVSEAGSLEAALDVLAGPDLIAVALVDLVMPGMAGAASLRALREGFPDCRFVVLSASESRADVLDALEAGVHGFIPKRLEPEEMVAALQRVLAGEVFVPALLTRLRGEARPVPAPAAAAPPGLAARVPPGIRDLTPRQSDVLKELANGRSTKEIAAVLGIAEGTAKIHLAAVCRALGARSRSEAVAIAARFVAQMQ